MAIFKGLKSTAKVPQHKLFARNKLSAPSVGLCTACMVGKTEFLRFVVASHIGHGFLHWPRLLILATASYIGRQERSFSSRMMAYYVQHSQTHTCCRKTTVP